MWQGVLGLFLIPFIAWLFSENRRGVNWQIILVGVGLQLILAVVFFTAPFLNEILLYLNELVLAIEKATKAGASFMFGYLAGGRTPFKVTNPSNNFIIAFQVLPIVLVTSAISAILFHFGILQKLVQLFSLVLKKTMGISGALGFGVAANVYLGVVEAPLFIRPYLKNMTRSELFTVMSAGMATVAGTVMVLYASVLKNTLEGAIGHILLASVLSAPAVIVISHLLIPGDKGAKKKTKLSEDDVLVGTKSWLEALVIGTKDGMYLLLNIIAMIVVLFALVNLFNQGLALIPLEGGPLTLQKIFGYAFRPLVWLMGVPSHEINAASELMSTKVVFNEYVSYSQMAGLGGALSEKTRTILTYAMCGFANFASVGLIIGSLTSLMPQRQGVVVNLAFKSMFAGVLSTCLTGALAGLFL